MKSCPRCGFQRFGDRLSTEQEAARIRTWAMDNRVHLTQGELLRVRDAADYAGRTGRTVRRWIDGDLESVNLRGRRFVAVDTLAQFIVENYDH